MGTCVHTEHEEKEVTITMQDPTGYAIVTIVDYVGDCDSKNTLIFEFDGPLLIQDSLILAVVTVQGEEMVKATVDLAEAKLKHMPEILSKGFDSRLQATPTSHFMFDNPFLGTDT